MRVRKNEVPSPLVQHLQSITCSASPAKHHLQCITCKTSPAVPHMQCITCSVSPAEYHLQCISVPLREINCLAQSPPRIFLHKILPSQKSGDLPLHYRLSSIKGVPFRFANFASHFICVQIFQIYFPPILSASKYFR